LNAARLRRRRYGGEQALTRESRPRRLGETVDARTAKIEVVRESLADAIAAVDELKALLVASTLASILYEYVVKKII
jgi:hypothetical protein